MTPTVGRIVHLARGNKSVPMIITDVHSDTCVSGIVFDAFPGSNQPVQVATSRIEDKAVSSECAGHTDGCWHWPERS